MEEASTGVDRRIGIVREERWPRVWNWFLWLIKDRLWVLERVGEARFSCWSFEKKEIGHFVEDDFFLVANIKNIFVFFWKWSKIIEKIIIKSTRFVFKNKIFVRIQFSFFFFDLTIFLTLMNL